MFSNKKWKKPDPIDLSGYSHLPKLPPEEQLPVDFLKTVLMVKNALLQMPKIPLNQIKDLYKEAPDSNPFKQYTTEYLYSCFTKIGFILLDFEIQILVASTIYDSLKTENAKMKKKVSEYELKKYLITSSEELVALKQKNLQKIQEVKSNDPDQRNPE